MRLIDADALIDAICRSSMYAWSVEQDQIAHNWVLDIIKELPTITPQGDLISRADAIAYPLSWEHYDMENGDIKFICGVESYREYIEHLPPADVVDIIQRDLCFDIDCETCPFMGETCKLMDYVAYADRPHGEWVKDDYLYKCSVCGNEEIIANNFCPSCGANMRGCDDDE